MFNFSFKKNDFLKKNDQNKELENPSNVKVYTSSKFINKLKDNYQIKEELEKISNELDESLSKNREVSLKNIKLKLSNIIKNYPEECFSYFLLAKVLNYFKDYYNAYKYLNISIEKGYYEVDNLRKELLSKIIKSNSLDNYYLEQELYKTIQIFSKEQAIYKVSFKNEEIEKIEKFYEEIGYFCNEITNYDKKDKFVRPCEVLLNKLIGILEKSVLLNILYEGIKSRMNYLKILNKYSDINKIKAYSVIISQLIIFENILNNINISKNSELILNFKELYNEILFDYSYEEDFLDDFFNYDEYNDFEEEREPKIISLHKIKVNIRDNSKLIGILIKNLELYNNLSEEDIISEIIDYIDELEYVVSFLKKNINVSIEFLLKLELVVSSYLSWFLILHEKRNNIDKLARQILEINIKKIKLCL
ncbi:MAG: hypothetical protein KatS3mg068_2407 [Candidatus Sericytochromatia bacterium]|nr:MAG: hypothetical protein KatS3mg068_2407 [Candidatus Sericytochromatia bacterium]